MPELPEVETLRRTLVRHRLVGRTLSDVTVAWERTVGGDARSFSETVDGRRVEALSRRGKYLVMTLGGGITILTHLRMSGRLWIEERDAPLTGYERVRVALDDGRELRFHDPRKFGRMLALAHPETVLDALGFEPLEGTVTVRRSHWRAIITRRRAVKALLLDQTLIAGLGNIYTDEALWLASIAPMRRADTLTSPEIESLRRAVERVLERGISNLGTALGDGHANFVLPDGSDRARNQEELAVFRRTGQACLRCGAPIVRTAVAGRSTHYCPLCQRTTAPIRRASSS